MPVDNHAHPSRRWATLGVTLPQFSVDPGAAVAACLDARRLGFGGGFVFDHLWPLGGDRTRPALECWTLLAALAAEVGRRPAGTDRFRVGTMVTRAGLRAPALVARMAATVGQAAGAPPIVGIGRGDLANRDENLAFGLPFPDAGTRAQVLEATLTALRGPLGGSAVPQVWVGGAGAGTRALAGRLGDAWNGWALTPEELAAGLADVRRVAEQAGRDPASVAGTWGGQVLVAAERGEAEAMLARWGAARPPAEVARVVAGDPETVLARLAALGDAGAAWCVLATVGGQAAAMRAMLAAAAHLSPRD
jgi:alkanesulfonate monooxygenase SsuD/methylene tetrahydromethanopterin reductase-like flavin-dependent oxidoreductase (luciferase family)